MDKPRRKGDEHGVEGKGRSEKKGWMKTHKMPKKAMCGVFMATSEKATFDKAKKKLLVLAQELEAESQ